MHLSLDHLNSSDFQHAIVALLKLSNPHLDSYIEGLRRLHVNQTGTVGRQ